MSYNLIDNFEIQGWDFLIPVHMDKTLSGEYVDFENVDEVELSYLDEYGLTDSRRDEYEPDVWETDSYLDDYIEEDTNNDNNEFVFEVPPPCHDIYSNNRPQTLYDLKYELDCDSMSDEDFLSMSAGDLIGITNSQLKFINKRSLQSAGISRYRDMIRSYEKELPSIEQRIRYLNVMSLVSFNYISLPKGTDTSENKKKLDKYLISIALKHELDEAVQLILWYKDYLGMYLHANIINNEHREDGEPYFDYVLFPKPSHIKDLHDKAARDYSIFMSRRAQEQKERTNRAIDSFISTSLYQRYLYNDVKYSVLPVTSVDDILKEADTLKHCVASYIDDFAKGRTLLYFIRSNSSKDTPLYTVEVLPEDDNNIFNSKMYLNQCYGYKDTIDKSDELRDFITKWCKIKKLKIECPI